MRKYWAIAAVIAVASIFCGHTQAMLNTETALGILRNNGGLDERMMALRHFLAQRNVTQNLPEETIRGVFDEAIATMERPEADPEERRVAAYLIYRWIECQRVYTLRGDEDLTRIFVNAVQTVIRGNRGRWFDVVIGYAQNPFDLPPEFRQTLQQEAERLLWERESMQSMQSMHAMWDSQSMDSM
jgi:hypothetical protein